jgi:hypothetical protein
MHLVAAGLYSRPMVPLLAACNPLALSQPTCRCAAAPPYSRSRCPWALASWAAFSMSLVYLIFALRWMTGAGVSGAGRGHAGVCAAAAAAALGPVAANAACTK